MVWGAMLHTTTAPARTLELVVWSGLEADTECTNHYAASQQGEGAVLQGAAASSVPVIDVQLDI